MGEERGNAAPKVCGEFSSGGFALPSGRVNSITVAVTTSRRVVAGESAKPRRRFVPIREDRDDEPSEVEVQPNGDHTVRARYAAHRARPAIDKQAVLLASGDRRLSAASRPG
jgi:hypothetical protein